MIQEDFPWEIIIHLALLRFNPGDQPRNITLLGSGTSPDVNISETQCLKHGTIASLRAAISGCLTCQLNFHIGSIFGKSLKVVKLVVGIYL